MAHALRRDTAAAAAASVIVSLPSLLALAVAPARAIPRLDLTPYPKPTAAQTRWVIQLPGVLPPTADPRLSPNPSDWRVQLIAGREV